MFASLPFGLLLLLSVWNPLAASPTEPDHSVQTVKYSFVHDNPSFMQSIKKCIEKDDLDCFKTVKTYFEALGQVRKHHRLQLPHLAAKLNGFKIFKTLNIDNSSSYSRKVLVRAYLMDEENENKPLTIKIRPARNSFEYTFRNLSFLHNPQHKPEFYSRDDLIAPYHSMGYTVYMKLKHKNAVNGVNLEDFNFVLNQTERCSSILDILDVLRIADLEERRQKIKEMKSQILHTLNQGSYVMDDIILNSANTVYLWWKYAMPLGKGPSQDPDHDDGGASDFVYWLINEGAPLDDMSLMLYYANYAGHLISRKEKFKELLRVWSFYGSGGPTVSMLQFLLSSIKWRSHLFWIHDSLKVYKSIGANMFDKKVLWRVALSLTSWRYLYYSVREWDVAGQRFKQWYVDIGLQEEHLETLKQQIPSDLRDLLYVSWDQEKLEKLVAEWEGMIQYKKRWGKWTAWLPWHKKEED